MRDIPFADPPRNVAGGAKISTNYGHNSYFAPIGRDKRKLTQIKFWQYATNIGNARIARQ
jgi:hypothetical protein